MPLEGWDHVELWVGNAKQAAYFFEHAFGFRRRAYAGPETGVRDRASYVLRQGEVVLVLTSALSADHEVGRFASAHGDAVKDIALRVPNASEAYRVAVERGARGVREPEWLEDEYGRVEVSAIATYGEVIHTFVARADYAGAVPAGLRRAAEATAPTAAVPASRVLDHCVGNVELGKMDEWVELLRAGARLREHHPLRRRADSHRVLGADVEGDGGRRGEDQVPDQRAGRGASQEPDRRVPRVQRRPRRPARRDPDRRHRPRPWRRCSSAASLFLATPEAYYEDAFDAGRRDRGVVGRPAPAAGSSSTATRTATCSRSSRSPRRTGRRSSSR